MDDKFLEYLTNHDSSYRYTGGLNPDIFGDVDKSKLRMNKPVAGTPPPTHTDGNRQKYSHDIRKLKKVSKVSAINNNHEKVDLNEGQIIMHERFGKGKVIKIEGAGADKKAEISFDTSGVKKLLLRFARLKIIE